MPYIHFICQLEDGSNFRHRGLRPLEPGQSKDYTSGWWDLTEDEAKRFVSENGKVFLHNTKQQGAFIGGTVECYEMFRMNRETIEKLQALGHKNIVEPSNELRVQFTFVSDPSCKGAKWRGPNHAMAHSSGVRWED
ncbi:hypothetical protein N9B69_00225 [Amylibacter sp.]|nr:hypothetical protein [Amylibacter sp.]